MFYKYSLFFLIPLLFIGVSCSTVSQLTTSSPKRLVKKVKKTSSKGKGATKLEHKIINKSEQTVVSSYLTRKQVSQLKRILKKRKSRKIQDRIKMILGKHYFKKSAYKQALSYYSQVTYPDWKLEASLEEVKVYYQINKLKKASKLLTVLMEDRAISLEVLMEMYLLKLKITLRQDSIDQKDLLKLYCQILNLKNEKNSIYKEKARLLLSKMSDNDVLDIKSKNFIKPIKDLIFFRAGKVLFFREKFKRAHFYFKKFLRLSTEGVAEERALKYIQAIESRKKVSRRHIGAILPLSGPSANIGKRSLKGLKMGLGLYTDKGSDFQLVVLDSQGQPDKVRKAVQTLVTKHHVIAIVGGVLSRTASILAEESQNFGIPTILISQKSQLSKIGRYIFQNGLTSSTVTRQLAEHLVGTLGKKKFAILYPNDSYGVDYANAFWSAVEKKGGKVVGAQFYKPGETDFNGSIKRLTGTYYLEDRVDEYKDRLNKWYTKKAYLRTNRKAPSHNILPPVIDFEVLFIPDSAKTLSLIAPHLAYNDIKDVKLAGPTLWNQKKILRRHSKYINDAVFVAEGFTTKKFKNTQFYKKFVQIFGSTPRLFEVLSYESALALHQVIAGGASSRSKLREKLEDLKKFYGPMGEIAISKDREFIRSMQIFKMKDKKISPLASSAK